MTDVDEACLEYLFEQLEPVPEGYRVEIVAGGVHMVEQRSTHWEIIAGILQQLRPKYDRRKVLSDVRIDFPGFMNGFCPDLAALKEGAGHTTKGHPRYQDVEFIAEVISRPTANNDYGPKKDTYATAAVPVYLIADPYAGECHLFTRPEDGVYRRRLTAAFGEPLDLTDTVVGLALATDEFPRD
ncbi:Uma2 family endonuclease [Streptomyces sp. NPDC054933]